MTGQALPLVLVAGLYVVVWWITARGRLGSLRGQELLPRPWGWALLAVVGTGSALAEASPKVAERLGPDPDAFGDGEVWRLATSLLVQDGGWPGVLFALTTLAVTVALAGPVLPAWSGLAAYVGGGVLAGVVSAAALDEVGGGSAMGAIVVAVLAALVADLGSPRTQTRDERAPRSGVMTGIAALAAVLLIQGAPEGCAAAVGWGAGVCWLLVRERRERRGRSEAT